MGEQYWGERKEMRVRLSCRSEKKKEVVRAGQGIEYNWGRNESGGLFGSCVLSVDRDLSEESDFLTGDSGKD